MQIFSKRDILFSFIIPACNSEKTIARCLDSVLADINHSGVLAEVIVIENGSSDSTMEKLEEYVKKDASVFLRRSDKGVSRARNTGIQLAKGKKIIFVDSDDLWLIGSLRKIINEEKIAPADLEIYSYYKDKKLIEHRYQNEISRGINEISKCRSWLISEATKRMQVWAKVFDTEILRKNDIYFDEKLAFAEDGDFVIKYTRYCNSIKISKSAIYQYKSDTSSTMRSVNKGRIKGYILSMENTKKYMDTEDETLKKAFSKYIMLHLNIICVRDIFYVGCKKKLRERIQILRELLNMQIFSEALRKLTFKDCCSLNLMPQMFYKISFVIFGGGLCYIKSCINLWCERQSANSLNDDSNV